MRKLRLKKVVLRDLDTRAKQAEGAGPTQHGQYTCPPITWYPCPNTDGECFSYDPYQCWTNNQSVCWGTCDQYTCPYTCQTCEGPTCDATCSC